MSRLKDLSEKYKDLQDEITATQTIEHKLMEVLYPLTASKKLRALEKLSMKIRKENSIRINKDVEITRNKYPKVK